MASNNGGPWGTGGGGNRPTGPGGDNRGGDNRNGGRRPGDQPQIPEIEDMLNKGNEYLKVLMGGKGGGGGRSGGSDGDGPGMSKGVIALVVLGAVGLWAFSSFYTVKPEEQSVELFLGKFSKIGNPGLNFAPWPVVSYEKVVVTGERTETVGLAGSGGSGMMLTTDANIVDIDFQVVWNINDPAKFLFNLSDPVQTVQAVSEASMREIIAASTLAPILNRDRGVIADRAFELIQSTLDSYDSGITVIRVNLDKADPPTDVINAFRDVQAAEQERDRLQRQADAYANTALAGARGSAAQILEEAEGYRAQVVNAAKGEASRFSAVLAEYQNAPEVTRKRLYLEAMEEVYGGLDKIILDDNAASGQGVVPYLPLNELRKSTTTGGSN
ncbi:MULTISPECIES: FtsH protease activity modulator HflK [Roseobacteraceae]|jgi:membrane protease subunit HflK|uniref:Protein HflK n=1 Tax=Celeribacter baekdonensis TaxID=875171 RepID=A0A1G7I3M9_9RHOB|nr:MULTISPECIES: FtsH protease activity modulator HflK [Roseobacteraceae]KAB6717477.1 FtsH protease activity modulator HflK [Roseobacter sp. TSBP12]SDF07360.1 protease FtsH subunit HflK [Celeribacter baekdonensis]|tara:strand:+ start:3913 stop:5067 length:1155 start_codon:yes stop_codon:yes gene_type:complete